MNITEHFRSEEFTCKCGCGKCSIDKSFVERLEKLRTELDAAAINISSGYRCEIQNKKVGGSKTSKHMQGVAADLCVKKKDGTYYKSVEVARVAEVLGFKGIALINDKYIHLDMRTGNKWLADERTGKTVSTWIVDTNEPEMEETVKTSHIKLMIDDKIIFEGDVQLDE